MLEKQLQGSLSKLESKVEVNIEQDLENKVWHKVVDALGGKVKEQLAKQMGVLEGDLVNGTTAGPDLTLQPSTTAVVVPSVVAVKSPWTPQPVLYTFHCVADACYRPEPGRDYGGNALNDATKDHTFTVRVCRGFPP